jgi:hypothetical protein
MKIKRVNEVNDDLLHSDEELQKDLQKIREANSILKSYKDSPAWNIVIEYMNEQDVDYFTWNDLDVLEYYIQSQIDDMDSDINEQAHQNSYRMILLDMVQLTNNSRLTQELSRKIAEQLDEVTFRDFQQWLKIGRSMMNSMARR